MTRATGKLEILKAQRIRNIVDRKPVGAHLVGIDTNTNFPPSAASDPDLADTINVLKALLDLVIRDIGDLAKRTRSGNNNLQHGLSIGIELLDDRRFGRLRQISEDQVDLVANLLRCHIAVLFQKRR